MSRAREIADLGSPAASGLSNRNIVRNGAMEVHQRGGTITASTSGPYSLDRLQIWANGDGGFDVSQSTTAPAGFKNSLKVDVTSADTSIASDAYKLLYYRMEGVDTVPLKLGTANAVTATISFYVRSNVTGNHSFGIRNDAANRAYFALYNISVADTWERKSITIPLDTTGTWPTTTAGCLALIFSFASGSNFDVTSNNAWESGNLIQAANAVNLFSSDSNEWYMTGLQMEIGEVATPFEHEDVGTTLAKCQRYYFRWNASANLEPFCMAFNNGSTVSDGVFSFPVTMRATPTALEQSGTAGNYRIGGAAGSGDCSSVPTFSKATEDTIEIRFTRGSGLTSGQCVRLMSASSTGANAFLGWSAEL